MGTPSYMPPEQAGGKRGRGSGWRPYGNALGATLYAMITGRPPFQAATRDRDGAFVISDEPVPPRRLNATIPRDRHENVSPTATTTYTLTATNTAGTATATVTVTVQPSLPTISSFTASPTSITWADSTLSWTTGATTLKLRRDIASTSATGTTW